jgi:exodeoxyribonuclease-5
MNAFTEFAQAAQQEESSKWSPQQESALKAIRKWRSNKDSQTFRLHGYAGTGKTTLAVAIAETGGKVMFAAYTGKAASVMRAKGCKNASTIHGLIYRPRDVYACPEHGDVFDAKGDGTCPVRKCSHQLVRSKQPRFDLNADSDLNDASLLIVDEVSMVNEQIGTDLLSFNVPILVLGDPGQLPPIEGRGFFDGEPDFMLTEIHRQALNNPIIQMSMEVRQGRMLKASTDYGESRVIFRNQLTDEDYLGADQILVGRNIKRQNINRKERARRKFPPRHPVAGDKIVCLKNDQQRGLFNGTIWNVLDVDVNKYDLRMQIKAEDEDQRTLTVTSHTHFFNKADPPPNGGYDLFADYGYALTVHKAQGSQWDNVLLHDEAEFFRENAARWLYTGITRASEQITIVV